MIEVPTWFAVFSVIAILAWLVSIIVMVFALIKYERNPDHYRFKKEKSHAKSDSNLE